MNLQKINISIRCVQWQEGKLHRISDLLPAHELHVYRNADDEQVLQLETPNGLADALPGWWVSRCPDGTAMVSSPHAFSVMQRYNAYFDPNWV